MSLPDLINGLFELFAGFFVLMHCHRLLKDKQVKGVSLVATTFFTSWGIWNLYYYPHLGQWLSFFGGLSIVCANALWISMMVYYVHIYNTPKRAVERVLADANKAARKMLAEADQKAIESGGMAEGKRSALLFD